MKVFKTSSISKKFHNSVVAIGNFDGVHLGHKKIISEGRKIAKKNKISFGILSFEPLPLMHFNKNLNNYRLNNIEQKIKILKKLGVDFCVLQKFNKKFSNYSYRKFIKDTIHQKLKTKFVLVSNNFKFGKNREGNIYKLKEYEKKYNYKLKLISPQSFKKKKISSTLIRKYLKKGKIKKANKLLGRKWSIIGKVSKGNKRGRKIGFKTCNIKIQKYIFPLKGVYAVNVFYKNKLKNGIANFGQRPTFKGKKPLLEVNIFGFNKNLYKKELEIEFKKFIRKEKKFNNILQLKKQIKMDIKKAK